MRAVLLTWVLLMATVARAEGQADVSALQAQVRAAEQAFSKAMADRDVDAFASHVADDAVFFGAKRAADGKQIGVFNSIWRRDAEGVWRVVFDKGCPACPCEPSQ